MTVYTYDTKAFTRPGGVLLHALVPAGLRMVSSPTKKEWRSITYLNFLQEHGVSSTSTARR
jgi:hypothetical protein